MIVVQILSLEALVIQYSMRNGIPAPPLSNFVFASVTYFLNLNFLICKVGIIVIHTSWTLRIKLK